MTASSSQEIQALINQCLEALAQHNYDRLNLLVEKIHSLLETKMLDFSKEDLEKIQQELNKLNALISSAKSIVAERLQEVQNKIRFLIKLELGEF